LAGGQKKIGVWGGDGLRPEGEPLSINQPRLFRGTKENKGGEVRRGGGRRGDPFHPKKKRREGTRTRMRAGDVYCRPASHKARSPTRRVKERDKGLLSHIRVEGKSFEKG